MGHGPVIIALRVPVGQIGLHKAVIIHLFIGKCLGRPHPGNPGLDIRADLREALFVIHRCLRHPAPVPYHHQNRDGKNQCNHQGKAPLNGKHADKGSGDGEKGHRQILRSVMGQFCDGEQIAGEAAHDHACPVGVIKVKIQLLEMLEEGRPNVRLHSRAEGMSPVNHGELKDIAEHIAEGHNKHHRKEGTVQLIRQHLVHGISGYQRKCQVNHRHHDGAEHIQKKQTPVGYEV